MFVAVSTIFSCYIYLKGGLFAQQSNKSGIYFLRKPSAADASNINCKY